MFLMGIQNGPTTLVNSLFFTIKLIMHLRDPTITLLGIYLEMKMCTHKSFFFFFLGEATLISFLSEFDFQCSSNSCF